MTAKKTVQKGLFIDALLKTNEKIKKDRASSIYEAAKITYARAIEDMERKLKLVNSQQDAMLDFCSTNLDSMMKADEFDGNSFMKKDMGYSLNLKDTQEILDILKARYKKLFE